MKFLLRESDDYMDLVTWDGPLLLVVRQPGKSKAVYWTLVILFAGYLAFPLFLQGLPSPSRLCFWEDLLLWDFALGLFPWLIFLSLRLWFIPMELRFDLASRTYEWERGWPPRTNTTRGILETSSRYEPLRATLKRVGRCITTSN
jgi:hypothetical protein